MKTDPAILLPHNEMNRSAAEGFGPFGGQILLPDNNGRRISRLMLEEVDGVFQGACTHFYEENGLSMGNNRGVFSPDGGTEPVGVVRSSGDQGLAFDLETLEAGGRVYEVMLEGVASAEGVPLRNRLVCYTINRLRP